MAKSRGLGDSINFINIDEFEDIMDGVFDE